MSELKECPFCGGRMGDGLIALDNDDLRPRIAELVNARWERTCRKVPGRMKYGRRMPKCSECGCSLGDERWHFCPSCGAKVVTE